MIIMKRLACPPDDLWLLRLPTAPTTMRNLVRAHTLIGKIEGLELGRKIEVLASLDKTEVQFQTTVAQVTAKLRAQGMSEILNKAPVLNEEIPRGMSFETDTDVLNKNVTIYQDALARLGRETPLIHAERLRVSGLRLSARSAQNFLESDMKSQMEAFLRRREGERPARSWFSRMGSRIGSFLSRCVSFCRRTPVTDPISLQATELISESTEAFLAGFGAKNTCIFTEMLKGLNISDQLSTLNSEYANPAQKAAVKAALTELVHYHIEQGKGIEFTSAAIKGQIRTEQAVHDRDKGKFLRNDSLGSLAFSTFAKAVGGDCLIPIKEKMDAIGNAERMAIHSDQAALIAATTEVFDTVASLDRRMPESLKAVLRDVITAAGDEGKTAFNSTFFLRFLVPFLSVSRAANSPNKESNKIIADVLQKTANAWSRVETTVSFQEPARKFLEPLASQMIGEIDALVDRLAPNIQASLATAVMTNPSDAALGDFQDPLATATSIVLATCNVGGLSYMSPNRSSDTTFRTSSPFRGGGAPSAGLSRFVGAWGVGSLTAIRDLASASASLLAPRAARVYLRHEQSGTPRSCQPPTELLYFDRAHAGAGVDSSFGRETVSHYRAPDQIVAPNTLFSSGLFVSFSATRSATRIGLASESTEFGSGMLREGSSTRRSLELVFAEAASTFEQPAPALQPTPVVGVGSIARSSVRTAASGRQSSRYQVQYSPRDSARVMLPGAMAQTPSLSPVALRFNPISRLESVIHTLETDLNALARKGSLDAFQAALTEGLQTLEAAEVVADLVRKNSKDDCKKSLHALRGDIITAQDLGATLISARSTVSTSEKLQAYQTKRNAIRSSWKAPFTKELSRDKLLLAKQSPNTGVGAGAKKK